MTENKFLTIYKDVIEEQLHIICKKFDSNIYSITSSPRWINVNRTYIEDDKFFLEFKSTQSSLKFRINISENHYNYIKLRGLADYLWVDFREFRTEFLSKYYPTIKRF